MIAPVVDVSTTRWGQLDLRAGYSAGFSPGGSVHSPRAGATWRVTDFDILTLEYQRSGATVYSSDLTRLQFEHRF